MTFHEKKVAQLKGDVRSNMAVFICGSTGFVEAAAGALVELGHDPLRIKTERFGATGGG